MDNLTQSIVDALRDGKAAAATIDDAGTCNMDSVILKVRKSAKVEAAIAGAGAYYYWSTSKWAKGYIINPPSVGQGFKRTRAAEAMAKSLSSAGFTAYVHYVMD